jgi:hypothetical protein
MGSTAPAQLVAPKKSGFSTTTDLPAGAYRSLNVGLLGLQGGDSVGLSITPDLGAGVIHGCALLGQAGVFTKLERS